MELVILGAGLNLLGVVTGALLVRISGFRKTTRG